ncbi:MAG: pyridoxamine 5'-phosphate oxidase [Bdellovibrionales bacterium]|nr:pyridoxamine 5'-phosphate oxidase [Bdellovibrionales bacterium]
MNSISNNANPFQKFGEWLRIAEEAEIVDFSAMALATSGANNAPNVRMVLLRGFDDAGFVFYTNYQSVKASELEANPQASLLFFWRTLGRQIRISGSVAKVSRKESELYFSSRPRGSQLSAAASEQSKPIESRQALVNKVSQVESDFEGKDIPCPNHWGGYRLKPTHFEFWENGENRLHQRQTYTLDASQHWSNQLLQP